MLVFLFGTRPSLRRRVSALALPSLCNSVALMTRRMTASFNPLHGHLDFSIVERCRSCTMLAGFFPTTSHRTRSPLKLTTALDRGVGRRGARIRASSAPSPPTKRWPDAPSIEAAGGPKDKHAKTGLLIWIDSQSSSGGVSRDEGLPVSRRRSRSRLLVFLHKLCNHSSMCTRALVPTEGRSQRRAGI
jgi:hypothetical protein